jgi:DNA transposition AAA+ family ATPase
MHQVATQVKTVAALGNVALATSTLLRAMSAPEHLPRMVVFSGPSGFGKSYAASYLAARYQAYYIECKSTWTRKVVLQQILKRMGITPEATVNSMLEQVCEQLAVSGRALIVDEMDYLVEKSAVEIVRDIYEGSQAPIMLIGEELLPKKLKRWERFHGRILDWAAAQPADLDDAMTLAEFYCRELEVDADAVAIIQKKANGSVRRICVNLELAQEEAIKAALSRITAEFVLNLNLYTGEAPARRN